VTEPVGAHTPAARAFVWTGAALFAASLGYFLFSYVVTFRETAGGPLRARDVATNVALFSAFALHHSLLARSSLRGWVSRRLTPQLERSVYVWVASLMLILVCAWWRPLSGVAWEVTGAGVWLLRACMVAGLWLTLRSAILIDVWDLAGVRPARAIVRPPGSETAFRTAAAATAPGAEGDVGAWEFRSDGPYGWVRHPIYSGWFLIVLGVTPMTMTRLVFAVVSCAYLLVAIPFEERSLRQASGGAYEGYVKQVQWRLLPWVYGAGWWMVGRG
jgi:protein-S-isoprenylcysteine O-methyltransferase Ste14